MKRISSTKKGDRMKMVDMRAKFTDTESYPANLFYF